MARSVTTQNPNRGIPESALTANRSADMPTYRRLGVYAEPVNQFVSPAASDAAKLAESLGFATKGFTQLIDQEMEEAKGRENLAGQKSAMQGDEQDDSQSIHFLKGYQTFKGTQAALEDREQLQKDWMAAPKDKPFDQWAAEWYKAKGEGIPDKNFRGAYEGIMSKAVLELREKNTKDSLATFQANLESDAKQYIATIATSATSGIPISTYEVMRQDASVLFGVKDFDAMLHQTAKDLAAQGEFEAVERITALYDQKLSAASDGVPALAKFLPEKEEILNKAHSTYARMTKREKDATRIQLEEKFDELLAADFAKVLAGDMSLEDFNPKMTEFFKDHPQMGIEMMAKWSGTISRAGKREETAENERNLNDLLIQLHEGKANKDTFLQAEKDGRITGKQVSYLLNQADAIRSRNRSEGAADRAAKRQERAELKSVLGDSLMKSIPSDDALMLDGEEKLKYRQEVQMLRLAAYEELDGALEKGVQGKLDLMEKYQKRGADLYSRYTKSTTDKWANYKPTYTDKDALRKALGQNPNDPIAQRDLAYFNYKGQKGN